MRRFLTRHPMDRPGREAVLLCVAAAVLAVGALVAVGWVAGPAAVLHRAVHVRWWWLPLGLAGVVGSYAGYLMAYREVAHDCGGEQLTEGQVAALVATGFTAFLPAGGFHFDARALSRLGVARRLANEHALVLSALEYVVLAPVALGAAIVMLLKAEPTKAGVTLSWIIGVPAGTALALLAMRHVDLINRCGPLGRAAGRAVAGTAQIARLASHRRAATRAVAGMAAYWAGEIFALWACLNAFYRVGHPGIASVIVGYATGYALTRRTLPLAGAGITEALLPFALNWVGVALAAAVLGVAAYRLFNMWLPVAPGGAGLAWLRRHRPPRVVRRRLRSHP